MSDGFVIGKLVTNAALKEYEGPADLTKWLTGLAQLDDLGTKIQTYRMPEGLFPRWKS
jgi:hypothetical protein